MNSHRQRARRKTVTWQAGAIALLAVGIGVGFLPLGSLFGPGAYKPPEPVEPPKTAQKPTSIGSGALLNLASNLKTLAGKRDVPPPPPPEDTNPGEATKIAPPAPVVANTDWVYVGHMIGPAFKRAIITIGSAESGAPQLSMGEGESHDGTKLVAIAPDHIMVDPGDGNQKRIDLAQRSAATSWNTDQPKRPIAARGIPGMPGVPGQNAMSPPGQSGFAATNAAAMAEAQRRMKAAIAPAPAPQPPPMDDRAQRMAELAKIAGEVTPERREQLFKVMTDPNVGEDERLKYLRELGVPVDGTPDERGEYLDSIGLGPKNDPKLYELIREGGGSK